MTKDEAIQKMHGLAQDLPRNTPLTTQQLIITYHNKYGGKPAVAELCRVFDVTCNRGDDICGHCATEGMNRAMGAIAFNVFDNANVNAPTTDMVQ